MASSRWAALLARPRVLRRQQRTAHVALRSLHRLESAEFFSGWSSVWQRIDTALSVGGWRGCPQELRASLGGPAVTAMVRFRSSRRHSFASLAFAFVPRTSGSESCGDALAVLPRRSSNARTWGGVTGAPSNLSFSMTTGSRVWRSFPSRARHSTFGRTGLGRSAIARRDRRGGPRQADFGNRPHPTLL